MVGCVREKKKHLFNIYMCVVRNRRKVQMKLRVIAYTCAIESASLMWNKSSETRDQPNEVGCGNVKERKTRQWTHSQGGFLSTPIRNGFLKPNDVTPVLHMSQPCAFLHPFDYYLSSNVGRWRNSCSLWTPTAPKDVFLQIKIEITRKHFFFTSSIAFPWFFFLRRFSLFVSLLGLNVLTEFASAFSIEEILADIRVCLQFATCLISQECAVNLLWRIPTSQLKGRGSLCGKTSTWSKHFWHLCHWGSTVPSICWVSLSVFLHIKSEGQQTNPRLNTISIR